MIGEAVTRLSADVRAREPAVEWQKIAGLRDHQYFGSDVQILWDVVETKRPGLETGVRSILHD